MLFFIIQVITFSLIFIFLVHNIINFLKNTLTVTKIKDVVNIQNEKYDNILNILKQKENYNNINYISNSNSNSNSTLISNLDFNQNNQNNINDNDNDNNMKNELKNFIKNQLKNNNIENYNSLNSFENNNFSKY